MLQSASSFPPISSHTRCSRHTELLSVPVCSLGLSASVSPTQCYCRLLQRPSPHPSSFLVNSVPSLLKCHPLCTCPGQTSSHSLSFLNSAALNWHPSSGPLFLPHPERVLFIKQELSDSTGSLLSCISPSSRALGLPPHSKCLVSIGQMLAQKTFGISLR